MRAGQTIIISERGAFKAGKYPFAGLSFLFCRTISSRYNVFAPLRRQPGDFRVWVGIHLRIKLSADRRPTLLTTDDRLLPARQLVSAKLCEDRSLCDDGTTAS